MGVQVNQQQLAACAKQPNNGDCILVTPQELN